MIKKIEDFLIMINQKINHVINHDQLFIMLESPRLIMMINHKKSND